MIFVCVGVCVCVGCVVWVGCGCGGCGVGGGVGGVSNECLTRNRKLMNIHVRPASPKISDTEYFRTRQANRSKQALQNQRTQVI